MNIEDKIIELTRRPYYYRIWFDHNSYGQYYVRCYLEAGFNRRVTAVAGSMGDALDDCLQLLKSINHLRNIYPALDEQPNDGGNIHKKLSQREDISFIMFNRKFYVSYYGLPRIDKEIEGCWL